MQEIARDVGDISWCVATSSPLLRFDINSPDELGSEDMRKQYYLITREVVDYMSEYEV